MSSPIQSAGFYAGSGAVWNVKTPGAPVLTSIGQLGESNRTWLYDVNDMGVAVGNASLNQVSVVLWSKPIRWTAADGIKDLNQLLRPEDAGWLITQVQAINDSGQIVGAGRLNGSLERAIRLDPLPTVPDGPAKDQSDKTNKRKKS